MDTLNAGVKAGTKNELSNADLATRVHDRLVAKAAQWIEFVTEYPVDNGGKAIELLQCAFDCLVATGGRQKDLIALGNLALEFKADWLAAKAYYQASDAIAVAEWDAISLKCGSQLRGQIKCDKIIAAGDLKMLDFLGSMATFMFRDGTVSIFTLTADESAAIFRSLGDKTKLNKFVHTLLNVSNNKTDQGERVVDVLRINTDLYVKDFFDAVGIGLPVKKYAEYFQGAAQRLLSARHYQQAIEIYHKLGTSQPLTEHVLLLSSSPERTYQALSLATEMNDASRIMWLGERYCAEGKLTKRGDPSHEAYGKAAVRAFQHLNRPDILLAMVDSGDWSSTVVKQALLAAQKSCKS